MLAALRLGWRAGLCPPAAMAAALRQAVADSWAAGYHQRPALTQTEAWQWFLARPRDMQAAGGAGRPLTGSGCSAGSAAVALWHELML